MSRECAITLDNLYTLKRNSLSKPIAHLSATKMFEVCQALSFAAGCR